MAGVLLGGFDVVLGDVLAPAGTQAAHNFRSATRDSEPAGLATRPLWLRDGQSVVHIGTLKSEREIANVEVYQLGDDLSLQSALHADDGEFVDRSEEHTSELQSLMRISYAVFCLKNKTT